MEADPVAAIADNDVLPDRSISLEPKFDLVLTRTQREALKDPIEVVDDTDVRSVHVNLHFVAKGLRICLDLNRSVTALWRVVVISGAVTVIRPVVMPTVVVVPIVPVGVVTSVVSVAVSAVVVPVTRMGIGWK